MSTLNCIPKGLPTSAIKTYQDKTSIYLISTKRRVSIFEPEFELEFNKLIEKEHQSHFEAYGEEKIKNTKTFTLKQLLSSSDHEFEIIAKDYQTFYWGDSIWYTLPVANHFVAIGKYWRAKKIVLAAWNYHATYGSYNPYHELFVMAIAVLDLYPENFIRLVCDAITVFDDPDCEPLVLPLGSVGSKTLKALQFIGHRIGFDLVEESKDKKLSLRLANLGVLASTSHKWLKNILQSEIDTYSPKARNLVNKAKDLVKRALESVGEEEIENTPFTKNELIEVFDNYEFIEEEAFKWSVLLKPALNIL